jgi:DNA-damage-inducible protein J
MAKTSLLQVRIDTELKREAEKLFAESGLDTPSAVRVFFRQTVAQKAIPFPLASTADKTDLEDEEAVKIGQSLTPLMNNPIHIDEYQKFTRDELHDRKKVKLNIELKKANPCDDPDSYLNNPLHCGDAFRIFSKEELNER